MLNRRGGEFFDPLAPPAPVPVSVPELFDPEKAYALVDDGAERRKVAARFLEARIIKTGVECWQAIGRAGSSADSVKIELAHRP